MFTRIVTKMELAEFEKRVTELALQVEQSSANHHALVGRFLEAQNCLTLLKNNLLQKAESAPAETAPAVN